MYEVKGSNIILTRGDTFIATITMTRNGTAYTPVEGDSIRFAMKKNYSDAQPLITKQISYDALTLRIESNDTKTLQVGSYVFDIEITFANGDIDTFISGILTLTEEVY